MHNIHQKSKTCHLSHCNHCIQSDILLTCVTLCLSFALILLSLLLFPLSLLFTICVFYYSLYHFLSFCVFLSLFLSLLWFRDWISFSGGKCNNSHYPIIAFCFLFHLTLLELFSSLILFVSCLRLAYHSILQRYIL